MKVRSLGSRGGGGGCCTMLFYLATTLLYVILFAESVEGSVLCYVCSWHSPAHHGGTNLTDTCSHYNFKEEYATTVECEAGCKAVSMRKSKNENIVNFYKNCKSPSSQSKDGCTSMESDTFQYVTTCECSSDLCNSAEKLGASPIRAAGFFLFSTALIVRLTLTETSK